MEERLRELDALQRITTTEGWQSHKDISSLGNKAYGFDMTASKTIELDEEPAFTHEDKPVRTQLVAVRGETIGKIAIQEDPDRPLTNEEEELLAAITEEVAEALERARLFEASRRSAAELAVLNEMGNAFTEALDPESITENIFKYASQLLEVHDFYIAFYEESKTEITFPLSIVHGERITEEHPNASFWQPRQLESGGLTGHIITSRQPILIENNAEEILDQIGISYNRYGNLTQSWIGVPMTVGERVIGMINAQSEETPGLYNQHHLDLLTSIASQAAIAIDNARRFQLEQARAQQERLVRTITDKVRRGADIKSILRITLEELSNVLDADTSVIRLGTREQLLSPQKALQTNGHETKIPKEIVEDDSRD